ncbi:type II toxin-antitoxin system VapC family toxin [Mycobacterium shinjukuense]|uniref:Ribonuclease VapC n=1 Tax=Mycobacterium shinjukuense TaxID=398694 RepID=A0A7I7MLK5_9MYCO|nr:type II toxin-antitoxin system VapC family toxin [Mycobacterium shinjukuense]MCV6984326.1 type II toxin-antitoxin system VapC family toxin [Mycobacterium shinjukuense]ORB70939.1 VapC toxin family PIN domain ribonuclease [Mycobacterium shinjukuense]BBX73046.1 VapC ribonuclease [Mycobacterium shinjukuense]
MILVDSNIPMYLVGVAHSHKLDAQRLLESALSAGERMVTDAEVLQEICHRYVAIDRRQAIQPAFDAILGVVDEVLPIERADVENARDTVLRYQSLSAREALHLAVMARYDIGRLMSFDRGFDAYPGITRLG